MGCGRLHSKLSLINPIQPNRDHLLLVQCRIPRLSVHLSPQPSSIHLTMHREDPQEAGLLSRVTLTSLHFLTFPGSAVFCCSRCLACPALHYSTIGFLFYLFFLPCPRSSPRLPFRPLFFLCSNYAQPQP